MCGIVGYAGFYEPGLIGRMCDAIRHRGPDGDGQAEYQNEAMAIGMRRLAVIDLAGGRQPMTTADDRVSLVFNGEIYNFRELRRDLEAAGFAFHTQSDTEVVLVAYCAWGHAAWARLRGMFAVAIVDRRGGEPLLFVVRDHVGIKPVYFLESQGRLLFASEVKALTQWAGFSAQVDLGAVSDYLALRYVPGPGSLLEGVRKLPPGCRLTYRAGRTDIERWWSPPTPKAVNPGMNGAEADALFEKAMRRAVERHMISDVPVGAFLSGGIDSNVIVALMAQHTEKPVRTFTIGFPDFPSHEGARAALTAKVLGTDHHAIECRAADMAALPDIAYALDEPVGDAIVVPMYVLAREARREVTVVLSGEGADEILGGYMFHRKLAQLETLRGRLPGWVWPLAAGAVGRVPVGLLGKAFDYPGSLGVEGRHKVVRLLQSLGRDSLASLYQSSISLFDAEDIRSATIAGRLAPQEPEPNRGGDGPALDRLIALQYADWLPDDILMKADKMSMAHSLEARVPFMDPDVVAAASRIPGRHKLAPGSNKRVLRRLADKLLPPEVARAPKQAFYLPLESYVRTGPVGDILRYTLDPERTRRRGLFRPEWVSAMLQSPPEAGFLPLKRLFSVVMLELWFDRFCPDASWA